MKKSDTKKIKKIKAVVRRLALRQFLRTYAVDLLKPLTAAGIFITLVFSLTKLFLLPQRYAGVAALAIVLSALVWVAIGIFKTIRSKPLSLKTVTEELQEEYPGIEDRFINAISLMSKKYKYLSPVTRAAIDGLAEETVKKASRIPGGVFSLKKFYRILGAFIAVVVLFFFIFTADAERSLATFRKLIRAAAGRSEYELQVEPGNAEIPQGSDFKVKVLSNAPDIPVIKYTMLGKNYSDRMQEVSREEYSATVNQLETPLVYSISADRGRLESPRYKVSLQKPPEVEKIEITYNYPAYTAKPPKVSTAPQITAPRGTVADITVHSESAVEKAYFITDAEEKEMEIKSDKTLKTSLNLQNQSYYMVKLYGKNETENDPVRYPLRVVEDKKPEVELIMPRQDIVVTPDAKVEIRGRAEDEFGLSRIYIRYYIEVGGEYREESIKREPSKSETFSYSWEIFRTPAGEGSVITYSVVAEDINTLYGPGSGHSKELRIEIEDFGANHREVLDKADALTEKLFDLLEQSYENSMLVEGEEYEEASKEIDSFEEMTSETREFLKSLLEAMEQDPYLDSSVMQEYAGLSDRLQQMTEGDIPRLSEMVENKSPHSEAKSREITEELERVFSLSEQATGRQRMNDVLYSAEDALNKTRDLSDLLNDDPAPEDIMQKLSKLQEMLNRMMESLVESPDKLPDEFMHEESMENLDFEETRQQFSKLYEALAQGDYEKARKLLNQFSASLENMLQKIQGAGGEAYKDEMKELNSRMIALSEELKETAKNQAQLIEQTEKSLNKLHSRRDEYEKEKLKELKEQFRVLQSTLGTRFPDIDREMRQGYLYRTEEILNSRLEKTEKKWEKKRLKEFIQNIKRTPPDKKFMTDEIVNEINKQMIRQEEIKEMTETLKRGFESFSHQTAMMDMEIIENLEKAADYMNRASGELEGLAPAPALENERIAYSHLMDSSQKSKQFMEKLMSLPQQMAPGVSDGFRRMPGSAQPRQSGFREGYVEIPAPGEDMGGEEFRRRVIEALKKEYPQQYRRLIEEYFRSLSE